MVIRRQDVPRLFARGVRTDRAATVLQALELCIVPAPAQLLQLVERCARLALCDSAQPAPQLILLLLLLSAQSTTSSARTRQRRSQTVLQCRRGSFATQISSGADPTSSLASSAKRPRPAQRRRRPRHPHRRVDALQSRPCRLCEPRVETAGSAARATQVSRSRSGTPRDRRARCSQPSLRQRGRPPCDRRLEKITPARQSVSQPVWQTLRRTEAMRPLLVRQREPRRRSVRRHSSLVVPCALRRGSRHVLTAARADYRPSLGLVSPTYARHPPPPPIQPTAYVPPHQFSPGTRSYGLPPPSLHSRYRHSYTEEPLARQVSVLEGQVRSLSDALHFSQQEFVAMRTTSYSVLQSVLGIVSNLDSEGRQRDEGESDRLAHLARSPPRTCELTFFAFRAMPCSSSGDGCTRQAIPRGLAGVPLPEPVRLLDGPRLAPNPRVPLPTPVHRPIYVAVLLQPDIRRRVVHPLVSPRLSPRPLCAPGESTRDIRRRPQQRPHPPLSTASDCLSCVRGAQARAARLAAAASVHAPSQRRTRPARCVPSAALKLGLAARRKCRERRRSPVEHVERSGPRGQGDDDVAAALVPAQPVDRTRPAALVCGRAASVRRL